MMGVMKMKTWKRNLIVAAVLVLICTGIYLNWRFGGNDEVELTSTLDQSKLMDESLLVIQSSDEALEALAQQTQRERDTADYFARMRLSRQESRDSALHLLQETISYASEGEDLSAPSSELDSIVTMSLSEASIESLVIAKGYADCVAYMTNEGISLAVAASEEGLQDADIAVLTDIVLNQTDYELPQIRIVEVR